MLPPVKLRLPTALLIAVLALGPSHAAGPSERPDPNVPAAHDGEAGGTDGTAPAPLAPGEAEWQAARELYWQNRLASPPDLASAAKALSAVIASPVAAPALRRDAAHLLGRLESAAGRWADAAAAYRTALELGATDAPSHLLDLLRFGLAQALCASGDKSDEPLALLAAVEDSPYSPLRADAAYLRARHLEVLGRLDDAKKAYKSVKDRWPDALFERELESRLDALGPLSGKAAPAHSDHLLLASLGNGTTRVDRERVPLSVIDSLLEARRYDQVDEALAPWLVEPAPGAPASEVDGWLDALERQLDNQYENFRWDDALATNEKLRKNKRPGLSKYKETRLYALDGDFDKARAELKKRFRGKAYWAALGDLAFEFARYAEAYDAWQKVAGKRAPPSDRMIWCLLRMGQPSRAAKAWEKLGKTRGYNRNLFERYWYARARQLADQPVRELYQALVDDAPLEYYGLQAWSRLQEIDGTAPVGVAPPVPTVPRKNDEPLVGNPTVAWTAASLAGAFDRAARPAPLAVLLPKMSAFAERWGPTAEEARRAAELAGLGDLDGAIGELRVIDMDMRALRAKGAALGNRARSDLLDNRGSPRGRGGAAMRETTHPRKTGEQAAAMSRQAGAIRKDLRELQELLAEPYGMRRAVLEQDGMPTPELLAAKGPALYPLAYPDVVRPLTEQFGLPPYFLYGVMTVESAFHPGAVSVSSAYGLVQVIPRTGENLARELGYVDFTPERLLEPSVSIYFGGYYLARLLSRFHGQEPLAAAAYNAGPHRVATWLMARGTIPMDMFIEDIPYDQARGYTKTVLEHVAAYRRIYHGEEHLYIRNTIDPTMGDGPNY